MKQEGRVRSEERNYHKFKRSPPGLIAVVTIEQQKAQRPHDEQLYDGNHHNCRLAVLITPAEYESS